MPKCILEQSIKIKDYLSKINKPVKTNSIASKYSIVFLTFKFVTNFLKPLPNKAQTHIEGKHITAAVIVTNTTPIKIFSSLFNLRIFFEKLKKTKVIIKITKIFLEMFLEAK